MAKLYLLIILFLLLKFKQVQSQLASSNSTAGILSYILSLSPKLDIRVYI